MNRSLPVATMLLLTTALHAAPKQRQMERRCGWIDNPTPGNWWIEDSEASWTISLQGGYQADGEMPDFESSWVQTNGFYGYGCGCMTAQVDRKTKRIIRYRDVKVLPLQRCQSDKKLKRR